MAVGDLSGELYEDRKQRANQCAARVRGCDERSAEDRGQSAAERAAATGSERGQRMFLQKGDGMRKEPTKAKLMCEIEHLKSLYEGAIEELRERTYRLGQLEVEIKQQEATIASLLQKAHDVLRAEARAESSAEDAETWQLQYEEELGQKEALLKALVKAYEK